MHITNTALSTKEMHANAIAVLHGEPITEIPTDLYIPPDALAVFLESFSGPLDLLLYLIKKNNLDIRDIPIAEITQQYIAYVNLMQSFQLHLAAEYLVMAATLADIKSRCLLPAPPKDDTDGEQIDPRNELIRRLQAYESCKLAADALDQLPRLNRDIYLPNIALPPMEKRRPLPNVSLLALVDAFKNCMQNLALKEEHHIAKELLSVREKMSSILSQLQEKSFLRFSSLCEKQEGRLGLVVSFIATLELLKQAMAEISQQEAFGEIYLKLMVYDHTIDESQQNKSVDASYIVKETVFETE